MNHKRVYRLYREENLELRTKTPRHRVSFRRRLDRPEATRINDCHAMDSKNWCGPSNQIKTQQVVPFSGQVIDTCRKFNVDAIKMEELLDATLKLGLNIVIDSFHVVHDGDIAVQFFTDEKIGTEKGIWITDDLFRLTEKIHDRNIPTEVATH